jgi:hypothetical protein
MSNPTVAVGCGPYETCRQAFDDIRSIGRSDEALQLRLVEACQDVGVRLGVYDRRILAWLAGWEPETVQVVTGLIRRAAQGGRR